MGSKNYDEIVCRYIWKNVHSNNYTNNFYTNLFDFLWTE